MLERVLSKLDLSDTQRDEIEAIIEERKEDFESMGKKQRGAFRKEIVALLAAEQIDRNAIENLRQEHVERIEVASKNLTETAVRVAEVLTPEQRAQLAEKMQKMRRRHHGGEDGGEYCPHRNHGWQH